MRFLLLISLLVASKAYSSISVSIVNTNQAYTLALTEMENGLVPLFDTLEVNQLNNNGIAVFTTEISRASIYYLSIKDIYLPIPLEPKTEYNIVIEAPKNQQGSFSQFTIIQVEANGEKQQYYHDYIHAFNSSITQFAISNPGLRKDSSALQKLDSLQITLEKKFSKNYKEYPEFEDYTSYKFCQFADASIGKIQYINTLKLSPIDYSNSLMVNTIIDKYTSKTNEWLFEYNDELRASANDKENSFYTLTSLFNEGNICDSTFTDLMLFHLLYTNQLPGYSLKTRLRCIKQLGNSTKESTIEEACRAAYTAIGNLMPHSKAPDFSFSDDKGKVVSLKELEGRFIYLQFWSQHNTAGLLDLKLLDKLRKTYGKKIVFISIHCNGSEAEFEQYMSQQNYKWPIYHVENDHPVLQAYAVKTTPIYYLIDPKGYLFRSPAQRPNRMYNLFDQINEAKIDGVKEYELIETYD